MARVCGSICGKHSHFLLRFFPMTIVGRYLWFQKNEENKYRGLRKCVFLCCNLMPKVRESIEMLSLSGGLVQ